MARWAVCRPWPRAAGWLVESAKGWRAAVRADVRRDRLVWSDGLGDGGALVEDEAGRLKRLAVGVR